MSACVAVYTALGSTLLVLLTVGSCSSSAQNDAELFLHRLKRQTACKAIEFKCADGECIPSYNVCDGPKDCTDGSDEIRSTCKAMNIRCPTLAFQCSYGACIDRALQCDGKPDCADESDEQGCTGLSTVASCKNGDFPCSNGQCISQYSICDGTKDCSDGSDETSKLCKHLKCLSNSFQCDYGACLGQSVKCNGVPECPDGSDEVGCSGSPANPADDTGPEPGGCTLPEHPAFGVYVSSQCHTGDFRPACRNTPGSPVPTNWLLKYSCNTNYELSSLYEYSVCENGVWKNKLDCIKLCPPLQSLSVDVRCVYEGREVSCDGPMRPGTWATAKCKQHYTEKYKPDYSRLTCLLSGDWNYRLFYCVADCGTSTKTSNASVEALILKGIPTVLGEFPWLTAIFLRDNTSVWDQQCGGTLISPHIVLTAAHCLVFLEGTLKPEDVKVGLGKYYRDFYKPENSSRIANVREIVVPPYYSGEASFYALDIALLDLEISIQVSAHIMPACVDWSLSNPTYPSNTGHVAGWGTTENGTSSETVLATQLETLDNGACIKKVRLAFKRLVTHDKFCAESNESGGQVDRGDSGGGLTAVKNGQHFVIGVVSTRIRGETTFSLFTNISNAEHFTWLEQQRTRLDSLHRET